MLINGLDIHPKRVLSCNLVDDQFLDRSCVIFPGSCASKSCDIQVAKESHDKSYVGLCDMFPQSCDAEVTGL